MRVSLQLWNTQESTQDPKKMVLNIELYLLQPQNVYWLARFTGIFACVLFM
jgi:hypothetical protein